MNCNELKNPKGLTRAFQSEIRTEEDRALNCFHELFYSLFYRMAARRCAVHPYARQSAESLINDAFNRGLTSFYFKIKRDGFIEGSASVQTAFLSFCLMQLRGVLTTEQRYFENLASGEPTALIEVQEKKTKATTGVDEAEVEAMLKEAGLFKKAFAQLSGQCQKLIVWRKLLHLKDEDIAARSEGVLKPSSVPQAVSHCWNKLKGLTGDTVN